MTKNGKLWNWYKDNRAAENVTVYYDRNRRGWFFKAKNERHGFRNSKDIGYSSRAQAIEGLKRYITKNTVVVEEVNLDDDGTVNLVQSFKWNSITRRRILRVKKDCYGHDTPSSSSNWVTKFIGSEHYVGNTFTVTGILKEDIENEGGDTFSLLKLFHKLGYEPMYDENNECIGLTDYTGGNQ